MALHRSTYLSCSHRGLHGIYAFYAIHQALNAPPRDKRLHARAGSGAHARATRARPSLKKKKKHKQPRRRSSQQGWDHNQVPRSKQDGRHNSKDRESLSGETVTTPLAAVRLTGCRCGVEPDADPDCTHHALFGSRPQTAVRTPPTPTSAALPWVLGLLRHAHV